MFFIFWALIFAVPRQRASAPDYPSSRIEWDYSQKDAIEMCI